MKIDKNNKEYSESLKTDIEKIEIINNNLNNNLINLKNSQQILKEEIINNKNELQLLIKGNNNIIKDLKNFKIKNNLNQNIEIQENSLQENSLQEINDLENTTMNNYEQIFQKYLLFFNEILNK